ncbi:MAG TPA: Ig-like domain-containing protein [Burkholderiales bacterium]|nr:Ig-like domain-containing protein [Burkholderiales bacterium]
METFGERAPRRTSLKLRLATPSPLFWSPWVICINTVSNHINRGMGCVVHLMRPAGGGALRIRFFPVALLVLAAATSSVSSAADSVTVAGVAAGSDMVPARDSRAVARTPRVIAKAQAPAGCRDNDRDGYSPDGGACGPRDCDDRNARVNPGLGEDCGDGIDNDCDGKIDSTDRKCDGTYCVGQFVPRPVMIAEAVWGLDDGVYELEVYGYDADPGGAVTIYNAATGTLLGATSVESSGEDIGDWDFDLRTSKPPCRVRVDINGATAERMVANAPNCGGATTANRPPVATIIAPAANVTITPGQPMDSPAAAVSAMGRVTVSAPTRPAASADNYTVAATQTLTVLPPGVLGNDASRPAGRPLSARLVRDVHRANLLTFNSDGSFVYTPSSRFRGKDRFTYQAMDGSLVGTITTVTITVTAPRRGGRGEGIPEVRVIGATANTPGTLREPAPGGLDRP